ncbi:ABC transporter ATP-binding protein, partial [Rhizobium johnstonii]
ALLELGSGFNPEFTGIENVYLNASILGLSRKEVDDRLQSILDFAEIGDHVHLPVRTYSSGMMLRLAFAVQVAIEPEVLIIDEALAVGDARFQ